MLNVALRWCLRRRLRRRVRTLQRSNECRWVELPQQLDGERTIQLAPPSSRTHPPALFKPSVLRRGEPSNIVFYARSARSKSAKREPESVVQLTQGREALNARVIHAQPPSSTLQPATFSHCL